MKKSRKLLRKLLVVYRDALVKKPFSKERSSLVDCIGAILESLK